MSEEPNRPKIDVECLGDPREFGLAIGESLRERIRTAERILPDFETFRLHQPWWMATSVFYYMAQRRARWALEPSLAANYPFMQERLMGIALRSTPIERRKPCAECQYFSRRRVATHGWLTC